MDIRDKDTILKIRIHHQMGLTNEDMAAKLGMSVEDICAQLIKLGKNPNIKTTYEPSEFKAHVDIPQGKVVRADKPIESACEIELSKLPY